MNEPIPHVQANVPQITDRNVYYLPNKGQVDNDEERTRKAQIEAEMDFAITNIKTRYPELDENSRHFNQDLTDQVLNRHRQLIQSGRHSNASAILAAANEVMRQRQSRHSNDAHVACFDRDHIEYAPPCKAGDKKAILAGPKLNY